MYYLKKKKKQDVVLYSNLFFIKQNIKNTVTLYCWTDFYCLRTYKTEKQHVFLFVKGAHCAAGGLIWFTDVACGL